MNIKEAIAYAIECYRESEDFAPTHCDVRCLINDLTQDNPRIVRNGYDQDRAWKAVRRGLGNPVKA